jgi:DNA-directed RNA polymerase subunit RPC12/RpoP
MALQDPVAVYNATNNVESHMLCNILRDAGIEAFTTDDVSVVGVWMFGLLPEIHKPQVWIDRKDVERAKPLLENYEDQLLERQEADRHKLSLDDAAIEVTCEECGRSSLFPAEQRDTVQDCPHCGSYVDVGDVADTEEWWNVPDADEGNNSTE